MRRVLSLVLVIASTSLAGCGSNTSALAANPWQLVAYTSVDPVYAGVVAEPDRDRYTLTFATDGTLTGQADCNLFAGTYRVTGASNLAITIGPSTLVACPDGSLGGIYVHALANASSWVVTGGDLTITLASGARLEFAPAAEGTPTAPADEPTTSPGPTATAEPTASPSPKPTASPSPKPSPTTRPTSGPTAQPTTAPTTAPTATPRPTPTPTPTPGLTGRTWLLSAITLTEPPFQGAIPPNEQSSYTITFADDLSFQARADCNTVSGTYTTGAGGTMTITLGPSTLVACDEGSYGDLYVVGLTDVDGYTVSSGSLTLTIDDGGSLQYVPQP